MNHPFYCHKKKCRKTAWDTPEYLKDGDWLNLNEVIKLIQKQDAWNFFQFTLHCPGSKDFFDRVLGWPEGYIYCQNLIYCEKTAISMLAKDLDKMQESIDKHLGKI